MRGSPRTSWSGCALAVRERAWDSDGVTPQHLNLVGWLTLIAVTAFAWWVLRPSPAPAPGVLAYSKNVRAASTAFALFAFAAPMPLVYWLVRDGLLLRNLHGLVVSYGVIAALTLPLQLEFSRVRHVFDDDGLRYSTPWSRTRRLLWADVKEVRFRPAAQWLDVTTATGAVHHFSTMLGGRQELALTMLRRVPDAALRADALTLQVLERMAEGAF